MGDFSSHRDQPSQLRQRLHGLLHGRYFACRHFLAKSPLFDQRRENLLPPLNFPAQAFNLLVNVHAATPVSQSTMRTPFIAAQDST